MDASSEGAEQARSRLSARASASRRTCASSPSASLACSSASSALDMPATAATAALRRLARSFAVEATISWALSCREDPNLRSQCAQLYALTALHT